MDSNILLQGKLIKGESYIDDRKDCPLYEHVMDNMAVYAKSNSKLNTGICIIDTSDEEEIVTTIHIGKPQRYTLVTFSVNVLDVKVGFKVSYPTETFYLSDGVMTTVAGSDVVEVNSDGDTVTTDDILLANIALICPIFEPEDTSDLDFLMKSDEVISLVMQSPVVTHTMLASCSGSFGGITSAFTLFNVREFIDGNPPAVEYGCGDDYRVCQHVEITSGETYEADNG